MYVVVPLFPGFVPVNIQGLLGMPLCLYACAGEREGGGWTDSRYAALSVLPPRLLIRPAPLFLHVLQGPLRCPDCAEKFYFQAHLDIHALSHLSAGMLHGTSIEEVATCVLPLVSRSCLL